MEHALQNLVSESEFRMHYINHWEKEGMESSNSWLQLLLFSSLMDLKKIIEAHVKLMMSVMCHIVSKLYAE